MKLTQVLSVLWLLVTASNPTKAEDLASAIAIAQNTTYLVCDEFEISGEYRNRFTGDMETKTFSIINKSCTLALQISDTEIVTTKTALSEPNLLLYNILTDIYSPSGVTIATSDMLVTFWRNLYNDEGTKFQTARITFKMPVRNMSHATVVDNLLQKTAFDFDRVPSDKTPFQIEDLGMSSNGLVRLKFIAPFPQETYLLLRTTTPAIGTRAAVITGQPSGQPVTTPTFTSHLGSVTNNHVLDQKIRSRIQTSGTLFEITTESVTSGAYIGGVVVDGDGTLIGLTTLTTTEMGGTGVPCGSGMTSRCLHYVVSGTNAATFINSERKQ